MTQPDPKLFGTVFGHCLAGARDVAVGSPCRWSVGVQDVDLAGLRIALSFWIDVPEMPRFIRNVTVRIAALHEHETEAAFEMALREKLRRVVYGLKVEYEKALRESSG